jgi:arylsulfatase A
MTRRALFSVAAVCVLMTVSVRSPRAAQAPSRSPNIVLVLVDDMGYADVGVFGAKGYGTPAIDTLAQEGVRATSFYVAPPVCTASRAALLTGSYPNRVGLGGVLMPKSQTGLNPSERTIPEILKTRGYVTGMVGKWHLGDAPEFMPTRHGYDEYLGIPYSNDMWPPNRAFAFPALPLIEGEKIVKEVTDAEQTNLTKLSSISLVCSPRAIRSHPLHDDRFQSTCEYAVHGNRKSALASLRR